MSYNNGFPVGYQQTVIPTNYPLGGSTTQPWNYQPIYSTVPINQQQQPYQAQQSPRQATINNGMIWVQGEAAAKSYSDIPPNTTLPLWDSENDTVYLKYVDAVGRPSMTILDYKVRNTEPEEKPVKAEPVVERADANNYVTREEFERVMDKPEEKDYITREEFEQRMSALTKQKQNPANRREQKEYAKSTV